MKTMNIPHLLMISTHFFYDACECILHIYRVFTTLYPPTTTVDISIHFVIIEPFTKHPATKMYQFHTWIKDIHL